MSELPITYSSILEFVCDDVPPKSEITILGYGHFRFNGTFWVSEKGVLSMGVKSLGQIAAYLEKGTYTYACTPEVKSSFHLVVPILIKHINCTLTSSPLTEIKILVREAYEAEYPDVVFMIDALRNSPDDRTHYLIDAIFDKRIVRET